MHLSNLGELYEDQERYVDAEQVVKQQLEIYKRAYASRGPDDRYPLGNVMIKAVNRLDYLFDVQRKQDRDAEIEAIYLDILTILERAPKREQLNMASIYEDLAKRYADQGRIAALEKLHERGLATAKVIQDEERHLLAGIRVNLARLYFENDRWADAEILYKGLLRTKLRGWEKKGYKRIPALNGLADLYVAQGRYNEAKDLLKRSIALQKTSLKDFRHPDGPMGSRTLAETRRKFTKLSVTSPFLRFFGR